jgi:F420H(2)-dependent quinone reductase
MRLRHVDPIRAAWSSVSRDRPVRRHGLGVWLSTNISWNLDPLLLELTRGRFSTAWPLATGVLETRGAKAGRLRRHATLYLNDGDDVIIVTSKRGLPEHPAWYHNLRKQPDVLCAGAPLLS